MVRGMSQPFPDYCFKDTALGDPNRRNRVMRADLIGKCIPRDRRECYTTWARFNQEFADYCEEKGSVKRYTGPAFADFLWLDVDSKDAEGNPNPTVAHDGAIRLVLNLLAKAGVAEEDLRIYFSGAKGFHIGIPTQTFGVEPSVLLPRAFKILAKRLAEQAAVTIDGAVYDTTRLWRLPNTVNGKTGLYKIPLTWDELAEGVEAIQELARCGRDGFEKTQTRPNTPNNLMASFYQQALKKAEEGTGPDRMELPVIQSNAPAEWPKHGKMCIARMLQGVTHERNNAGLRIAVDLRQKGLAQDVAEAAMQAWNRKNRSANGDPAPLDAVEVSEIVRKAYENGYDFGCHDPVLDAYCHETCFIYPQKMKESATLTKLETDILTVPEAMAKYLAYTKERDLANVSWGVNWLDSVTRGIRPGQVGMILARAGVGKTAMVNHIIHANCRRQVPSLFASLEQLAEDIFERMAQSVCELPGQVIEDGFYSGDEAFIGSVGALVTEGFAHAYICDKDALTIDALKAYVKAAEAKAGQKIRLLCVDYLGRMKGTGKDAYEKISEIAKGLKNVAKECHMAVIVVVQLNRTGGKGTVEVEMDMARDSGQIEEAADYAIGMWKASGDDKERGSGHPVSITTPEGTVMAPETDSYYPVMLKVLKNRKGPKGDHVRHALMFRGDVMRFEPIVWRPGVTPQADPETGEMPW
jgi:replicative DNA helicase